MDFFYSVFSWGIGKQTLDPKDKGLSELTTRLFWVKCHEDSKYVKEYQTCDHCLLLWLYLFVYFLNNKHSRVHGGCEKMGGGAIFVFYCIFIIRFLRLFKGVLEVPHPPFESLFPKSVCLSTGEKGRKHCGEHRTIFSRNLHWRLHGYQQLPHSDPAGNRHPRKSTPNWSYNFNGMILL